MRCSSDDFRVPRAFIGTVVCCDYDDGLHVAGRGCRNSTEVRMLYKVEKIGAMRFRGAFVVLACKNKNTKPSGFFK